MRRLKKSIFKGGAAGLVVLLAVIRCVFPGVENDEQPQPVAQLPADTTAVTENVNPADSDDNIDSLGAGENVKPLDQAGEVTPADKAQSANPADQGKSAQQANPADQSNPAKHAKPARPSDPLPPLGGAPLFADAEGNRLKHKIYSVSSYKVCFPDVQDVQITAAQYWGVRPVENREQAEHRMSELVYVGSNAYYVIDPAMRRSIPYLVPRAADLLQTIARNFLDSLSVKQIPAHKILVSSVLRTEEDVRRLRKGNGNASEQSCHRFGTTFDISYLRYQTVAPPGEERREVRNDSLKFVLSEVLNDVRKAGRCYIKYEVKQSCFHITVR